MGRNNYMKFPVVLVFMTAIFTMAACLHAGDVALPAPYYLDGGSGVFPEPVFQTSNQDTLQSWIDLLADTGVGGLPGFILVAAVFLYTRWIQGKPLFKRDS